MRRVQIGVESDKDLTYDSEGKPDEQAAVLRDQFRYMIGATAVVDLAAFDEGKGFEGLSAAWDHYLEENPDRGKWAEANRKNYGDARLDRMFTRGLPVLFGPDAGRAAGKSRAIRPGESYEIDLEILGIGREPAQSTHTVRVESVAEGRATLAVTWAANGHDPKIDGDVVLMRGGDIKGESRLTFHLASGLLVVLEETEKRTDQTCTMDFVQRTRHATIHDEFSIVPR